MSDLEQRLRASSVNAVQLARDSKGWHRGIEHLLLEAADTLAAVREAASFYRSCALGRETIRPEVDAKFLAVIDRSDTDE